MLSVMLQYASDFLFVEAWCENEFVSVPGLYALLRADDCERIAQDRARRCCRVPVRHSGGARR